MSGYIGTQPVPQATQTRDSFTATSGQTSFATGGYTPNFLDVYLNGVKLASADYTATNGSDVVLASGAATGDILEVVAYTAFDTANVTGATNFTVTGAFTSQGIDDNGNATALTIDSSENVLVGLTATEAVGTNAGTQLRADGLVYAAVTSDAHILSRRSSDGAILNFRKDTTTVGSVGVYNSDNLYLQGKSDHSGLAFGEAEIYGFRGGSENDGVTSLGSSGARFRNLYLYGGVFLGGTGSANKLSDYEEGLHTYTLKGASSGSATIPIRNGYTKLAYTKIGRMVTITGKIETLGSHSATGALRLSLPFTAANLTDQAGVAGGSCFVYRTSQSIYDNPAILPSTADPYAIFYYNTTSGDVATINANNLDAQFEILVSFSYFTNA